MEENTCTVIFEMNQELCDLTQNAKVSEILDYLGGADCLEIRFPTVDKLFIKAQPEVG